jgi:Xaa-Pro aminopeptidase
MAFMKSIPIPSELFKRNREKLTSLMDSGSVALIQSAEKKARNGDQFYPYRQNSNFFYLSGINQEDSMLILYPDCSDPSLREILFVKKPTPKSDLWSGPLLTQTQAGSLSGIQEVRWLEEADTFLELFIPGCSRVYADQKDKFEHKLKLTPLSPLINQLRVIKEELEIEEIKKAARITHAAFLQVLKITKPGIKEYQLEAEIIAEFIRQGARGHAYDPIVASGKNALILHYIENRSTCQDGELILLDFGAELNNYAADCSRTIPVNGRFSARQRELYKAVHKVFTQARERMRPGVLLSDFQNEVGKLWEEEHLRLGLYTTSDMKDQTGTEPLWKNYFMHGTSHSLGLDVHDPFDRSRAFEPGMLLTCEPAIYIPEEGTGIRLENDILITGDGPVDLLEEIPMEAEHIEDLMNNS